MRPSTAPMREEVRLLEAGETVRAARSESYWLDIGRHEDYETAVEEFERMKPRLLGEGKEVPPASG